jgi:CheY-like chemotaxis protein
MAEPQTEAAPEEQASSRQRILLVDDDSEIVESMRIALEAKGYQILIARDGNQGLSMAEREDPDLVILDMMMPKRSGFLVLEKLRRTRPVPMRVIMITANEGSRHKAYWRDYLRSQIWNLGVVICPPDADDTPRLPTARAPLTAVAGRARPSGQARSQARLAPLRVPIGAPPPATNRESGCKRSWLPRGSAAGESAKS